MTSFIQIFENEFSNDLCDRLIALLDLCDKEGIAMTGTIGTGNVSSAKKQSRDVDIHDGFAQGKRSLRLVESNADLYYEIKAQIDKPILDYVNKNIPNFLGETDYLELDYSKNIFIPVQPFKLKKYKAPEEGYHAWHQDWGTNASQKRMLVVMIYLNDVAEGGETLFFHQGVSIKPKKGTVVIFPPYLFAIVILVLGSV